MPAFRARQRNVVGGRRRRFEVTVTPEQGAQLEALAGARGVTVQRFLVTSALSPAVAASAPLVSREELTDLFGIGNYLGAIGRNLNQIAKATNATGALDSDISATLVAVRRAANDLSLLIRTDCRQNG